MTSRLIALNDATFDEWTSNEAEVTVVCVGAKWCANTQQLAPLLDELGAEYAGKVRFAMVDFDESPEFVKKHEITAVPTLKLFKLGICDQGIDAVCGFDLQMQRDTIVKAIGRAV